MRTTKTLTLLAASLIAPWLLIACERADQSPTAAAPGQEKQSLAASSPADKRMPEEAPPAVTPPPPSPAPAAPEASPPQSGRP